MKKTPLIRLVIGLIIGGALGALMGYFGQCSSGTCPLTPPPHGAGPFMVPYWGSCSAFRLARATRNKNKGGSNNIANNAFSSRSLFIFIILVSPI